MIYIYYFPKLYRMSINYHYYFQSLSKFYFLKYFYLICFIVKENLQVFSFLTGTCQIIKFKITIYLVIQQNIFEFNSESRFYENEHSARKSPVCFLVYRDKVRHPSTVKL